jgi:hypothetical protein
MMNKLQGTSTRRSLNESTFLFDQEHKVCLYRADDGG